MSMASAPSNQKRKSLYFLCSSGSFLRTLQLSGSITVSAEQASLSSPSPLWLGMWAPGVAPAHWPISPLATWRTKVKDASCQRIIVSLKQEEWRMNLLLFPPHRQTEGGWRDSRRCEALPSLCLSPLCLIGLPPPSDAPHPLPFLLPPLPAVTASEAFLPLFPDWPRPGSPHEGKQQRGKRWEEPAVF